MEEKPYKITSAMFMGSDEYGNHTYQLTFNQSLVHTGRWKGIEDGLNAYREQEIKRREQEILKEADEIRSRQNELGGNQTTKSMSIAAKCTCGKMTTYCIGGEGCNNLILPSTLPSNEDDGEQAIMDEDEMKLEIYKICRSNWSYSAARKELSKFKVTRK